MLPFPSESLVGKARLADVVDRIVEKLGVTPEERAERVPSGKQRTLSNRLPGQDIAWEGRASRKYTA